jgi:hypothetical protein
VKADGAEGFVQGAYAFAVSRADRATKALQRTTLASPKNGRANAERPPRPVLVKTTKADGSEVVEEAGTGDMIADAADASFAKTKDRWKTKKADRGARR